MAVICDVERAPFGNVIVARGDHETDTVETLDTRAPTGCRVDVALLADSELVAEIGRGSHAAFVEIYNRHGRPAHRLASLVGDDDDADDIVQDVFLRLWNQPVRFDASRGTLRSFLMMQIRSRTIDVRRSSSSRQARETTNEPEHMGRSAEDGALAHLAGEQTWSLLLGLDEGQRNAIGLAYFGGHTYREVAVLLALPEGTIKSRIRQGLTHLRLSPELVTVDHRGPNGTAEP